MAKLNRIKQEIFASQAGSREITAFGTAKNDNPTYTTDVAEIQNINYLYGWSTAILPDKAPYEEDTNALFYAITRQLAYLFQVGMPEWNAEAEYYTNSFCQVNGVWYQSLTDNNIGNNPTTDNINWKQFADNSTANYEIGLPQPTLSNTLLANEIWLEGQSVSRNTYAKLFEIYGTTYGAGDGKTTFKLPDFRNRTIWGASSFGYLDAGLPEILGGKVLSSPSADGSLTGAFYAARTANSGYAQFPGNGRSYSTQGAAFKASNSNPIYGKSNTVQPPAIKVRVKTRYY